MEAYLCSFVTEAVGKSMKHSSEPQLSRNQGSKEVAKWRLYMNSFLFFALEF